MGRLVMLCCVALRVGSKVGALHQGTGIADGGGPTGALVKPCWVTTRVGAAVDVGARVGRRVLVGCSVGATTGGGVGRTWGGAVGPADG